MFLCRNAKYQVIKKELQKMRMGMPHSHTAHMAFLRKLPICSRGTHFILLLMDLYYACPKSNNENQIIELHTYKCVQLMRESFFCNFFQISLISWKSWIHEYTFTSTLSSKINFIESILYVSIKLLERSLLTCSHVCTYVKQMPALAK